MQYCPKGTGCVCNTVPSADDACAILSLGQAAHVQYHPKGTGVGGFAGCDHGRVCGALSQLAAGRRSPEAAAAAAGGRRAPRPGGAEALQAGAGGRGLGPGRGEGGGVPPGCGSATPTGPLAPHALGASNGRATAQAPPPRRRETPARSREMPPGRQRSRER